MLPWHLTTPLSGRNLDVIDRTLTALKFAIKDFILLEAAAAIVEAQLDAAATSRAGLDH